MSRAALVHRGTCSTGAVDATDQQSAQCSVLLSRCTAAGACCVLLCSSMLAGLV
jgi:hypothetical protein